MRRQNQKSKWQVWYVPAKRAEGKGLTDRYGRVYIVRKGGALHLIQDAKAQTIR